MNNDNLISKNVLGWSPTKEFTELEKVLRSRIAEIEEHTKSFPFAKESNHHRIHGIEDAIYSLYNYCESHPNLVLFPVHIEQEVYRINPGAKEPVIPMTVTEISQTVVLQGCPFVVIKAIDNHDHNEHVYFEEQWEKDVFFTRKSAEQKLVDLQSENTYEETDR